MSMGAGRDGCQHPMLSSRAFIARASKHIVLEGVVFNDAGRQSRRQVSIGLLFRGRKGRSKKRNLKTCAQIYREKRG